MLRYIIYISLSVIAVPITGNSKEIRYKTISVENKILGKKYKNQIGIYFDFPAHRRPIINRKIVVFSLLFEKKINKLFSALENKIFYVIDSCNGKIYNKLQKKIFGNIIGGENTNLEDRHNIFYGNVINVSIFYNVGNYNYINNDSWYDWLSKAIEESNLCFTIRSGKMFERSVETKSINISEYSSFVYRE